MLAPEKVDKPLRGHDLARPQQQDGENRTLTLPPEVQDPVLAHDLERPQQAELEHLPAVVAAVTDVRPGSASQGR